MQRMVGQRLSVPCAGALLLLFLARCASFDDGATGREGEGAGASTVDATVDAVRVELGATRLMGNYSQWTASFDNVTVDVVR